MLSRIGCGISGGLDGDLVGVNLLPMGTCRIAWEQKMKFATAALTALALMAVSGPAPAQHEHHQTPYSGMQQRAVKSLNDTQIADLRAGRGMGLALAGELNGYPARSMCLS